VAIRGTSLTTLNTDGNAVPSNFGANKENKRRYLEKKPGKNRQNWSVNTFLFVCEKNLNVYIFSITGRILEFIPVQCTKSMIVLYISTAFKKEHDFRVK